MSDVASNPMTVRLPDLIRRIEEELAEREGIMLEQFIASIFDESLKRDSTMPSESSNAIAGLPQTDPRLARIPPSPHRRPDDPTRTLIAPGTENGGIPPAF